VFPAAGAVGTRGRTAARRRERRCQDGFQVSAQLHQVHTPELDQVQCRAVSEVDRRDQLGYDAQLRRKRPRLGHAAQHQVAGRVGL
jgi:hypothetical protein